MKNQPPYEAVSMSTLNPLADEVKAWKSDLWDAIHKWAASGPLSTDRQMAVAEVERAVERAMLTAIRATRLPIFGNRTEQAIDFSADPSSYVKLSND
jgi:hypothetical protein